MSDNIDTWIKFLDPDNLKGNLMSTSLYIASFEGFKDYVVEEVKFFYHVGLKDGEDLFSADYEVKVKSRDKSIVKATLLWLMEMGAINESDIQLFDELRKYRNKLTHELMDFIFQGLSDEFPIKFAQLIQLRVKIEKWWILNIEIPSNPDFDSKEVKEDDITTSSQIFNQLVFDMLSGDEKKASYYKNEFMKTFNK